MAIDLRVLSQEGALEAAEKFSLEGLEDFRKGEIVLWFSNESADSSIQNFYKQGDEVYLFSEEQAKLFTSHFLTHAIPYKVAAVEKAPAWSGVKSNTVVVNHTQAEAYFSLGIHALVVIKKADLDRIFCYHK